MQRYLAQSFPTIFSQNTENNTKFASTNRIKDLFKNKTEPLIENFSLWKHWIK